MQATPAASSKCVLIVEDDPEVRRLLKRLLAGLVQEFAECDDGSQALAAFTRWDPDVVLMDINLPGLDGISATAQIRGARPSVVVVVVSNHDDMRLRRAASEVGAAAYILKDNLLEVRALLERTFAS